MQGVDPAVLQGVAETEANRAVTALAHHGIAAHRFVDDSPGQSTAPGFCVSVPESDVSRAVAVLGADDIPRREAPGFVETFGARSLIESPDESRARIAQATAGELTRTMDAIHGVVSARVHIALPDPQDLDANTPAPRPSASVLVTYATPESPVDSAEIQRLVAGAVATMRPTDVAVMTLRRPAAAIDPPPLQRVGTMLVARESVGRLRAILAASALCAIAALGLAARERLARRNATPRAE